MLCDREPQSTWSDDRATLLEDATHPTLQYFAQEMGRMLEDPVVLATEVASNDENLAAIFQSYQKKRYLRAGHC